MIGSAAAASIQVNRRRFGILADAFRPHSGNTGAHEYAARDNTPIWQSRTKRGRCISVPKFVLDRLPNRGSNSDLWNITGLRSARLLGEPSFSDLLPPPLQKLPHRGIRLQPGRALLTILPPVFLSDAVCSSTLEPPRWRRPVAQERTQVQGAGDRVRHLIHAAAPASRYAIRGSRAGLGAN